MYDDVSSWADYGCPQYGDACNQRPVRVDEVYWVPCCMVRADLGGSFVYIFEGVEGYESL